MSIASVTTRRNRWRAWPRPYASPVRPVPLQHGDIGIGVMLISLVLTIALVVYQQSVIRRTGSLAVKADAFHYITDISMNLGVIAALILSFYFGWTAADPIIALFIAAYILYAAWTIAAQSFNQLMDRELPDEERARIAAIAVQHGDVIAIHDLRTRISGRKIFIELHLEMDGEMNLYRAHQVADEVQRKLQEVYPEADIIIHQDPAEI